MNIKVTLIAFVLVLASQLTFSQTKAEKEVLEISKSKWEWMATKDINQLKNLFDENAKYVHMSGTWKTEKELEIIETGNIWYKEAKVKDTAIEVSKKTAIVWNRITLVAEVRGSDVSNEFTVTEVYQKKSGKWKLLALTFSSVRDTHEIEK